MVSTGCACSNRGAIVSTAAPPNPGPGNRLLLPGETIQHGDQWTVTTRIGWGCARSTDIGATLTEARRRSTFGNTMWYRRKVGTMVMCGCGNHEIDASDPDPYTQHRAWVEDQTGGDPK